MSNHMMFAAPIALAIGLAAAPSAHAHGGVEVGVAVPPVVVDVAGVKVVVGQPPPPPPVIVYEEPRPDVVIVRERVYEPRREVVVVHERARPTVVYYDDDCGKRGRGHHKHGHGHHGHGHGNGNGHHKVKHARGHYR